VRNYQREKEDDRVRPYSMKFGAKIALGAFFLLLSGISTPAHATTTTALNIISITASSTNPAVYSMTFDYSPLGTGLVFNEQSLTGNTKAFPQCFPQSGGAQSGGASTKTVTVNTSVSHSGNTTGGSDPCNYSGYYYHVYYENGSTDYYYAEYFYDAGANAINEVLPATTTTPTVPINKNIEILSPEYGSTTATTTFNIKIRYQTPFSLDFRPTTTRYFQIVDAVDGTLELEYRKVLPSNSAENITISTTTRLDPGSKFLRAMYLDTNGGVYSEVDEIFFNVATNTYFIATGLLSPIENVSGLTQINCGTFEFGCQFQKALTFLFVPSLNTLDKFSNLWQTIAEKRPFGYFTKTVNALQELNTSGITAFTLGDIPFMDSIFTPFRTLIASILWAVFAIFFYHKRLKTLDI